MDDKTFRIESWNEIDLVAIVQTGANLDPQVLTMTPARAIELADELRAAASSFRHRKPSPGHGDEYGRFTN